MRLQQRPEADDVRALQQQLSSLHVLMEQASSEHLSETLKLQAQLEAKKTEGEGLRRELEATKEEREGMPKADDITKSVLAARVHTYVYSIWLIVFHGNGQHNQKLL